MRVALPPGVAGARGGKVTTLASLSIAINRQHTPINDIQIFRREIIVFWRHVSATSASFASLRPTGVTCIPLCLRSQKNHTTCAPCFAEGYSASDKSLHPCTDWYGNAKKFLIFSKKLYNIKPNGGNNGCFI